MNQRYGTNFNTYRSSNWKMVIFNLGLQKECWESLIEKDPLIEKIEWTDKNNFTITLCEKIGSNELDNLNRNSELFGRHSSIEVEVEDGRMIVKHEIDYSSHCEY